MAPSRRMRGSEPVRSITVEGVPGSSPPSTTAPASTANLLRHLVQPPGVGLAGTVRARRDEHCDRSQHLGARAAKVWDAHTDRVGVTAAQPGQATRGIPHDQGQRPGQQPAQQKLVGAAQLGYAIEQLVDTGGHECARLLRAPPLELVEPLHSVFVPRIGGETVDRVERQDYRLARAYRSDRLLDYSVRNRVTTSAVARRDAPVQRLPSTTRSRSVRSEVIVTLE